MFVVTLPEEAARDPMSFAERAKREGANVLEIRGDLTPEVTTFESPLPLIVSLRQTGNRLIGMLKPQYIDLAIGEEAAIPPGAKCIRSFHDFKKTPPLHELMRIAERCEEADIIKIATTINSYRDLSILDALYEALPRERVVLGMGVRAHSNRMLSPFRNALTYTYLDGYSASAPGQVPLSLHKLTDHCKSPKIFGLLGSPDIQSLSPLIHNSLLARNDVDALYTQFLTDDLDDAYDNLTSQGVAGFSVTSPFKQSVISKLDRVDERVEKIGTVNTIVREGTEYVGYARDIRGLVGGYPFLNNARSVAILGSGGVVPSVIEACRLSGARDIHIFARNQKASEALASKFCLQHNNLSDISSFKPDVLINAISKDVALTLPKAKTGAHAIDLRYGGVTVFQTEAKKVGYTVHDGMPMLLHQAIAQFRLFTGSEPSTESIQEVFSLLHYGKQ